MVNMSFPTAIEQGKKLVAYEYNGYWKDVGTLGSYWEANMELIDIIPEFNLYEEFWKIYTSSEIIPPQYISSEAKIGKSIIGDGAEIYGEVENSVIGPGVFIGKGAVVRDSIIMKEASHRSRLRHRPQHHCRECEGRRKCCDSAWARMYRIN